MILCTSDFYEKILFSYIELLNIRMIKYYGTYKDRFGETEIIVSNDFKILSLEIDGVKFSGPEFSGLAIIDKEKYSSSQSDRFSFFPANIDPEKEDYPTLCDCTFNILVPQMIIDTKTQKLFSVNLSIHYHLGKERTKSRGGLEVEEVAISLEIFGKKYNGTGGYIEEAFDQIKDQFSDEYKFKNCYGCLYSDYSVYGQSSFGTMLCFVNQKEKYLKVKNKNDYLKLHSDFQQVQEIYCCSAYEIRRRGTGYRG
jgi:hypothetical protein